MAKRGARYEAQLLLLRDRINFVDYTINIVGKIFSLCSNDLVIFKAPLIPSPPGFLLQSENAASLNKPSNHVRSLRQARVLRIANTVCEKGQAASRDIRIELRNEPAAALRGLANSFSPLADCC